MILKIELCFDTAPEKHFYRYFFGSTLKNIIRKVDKTVLRTKGKKVAHIISVEEIPYSILLTDYGTTSTSTWAY